MGIDWVNILERAAWKAALFSAMMAGLSAVKTFIIEVIQNSKKGE